MSNTEHALLNGQPEEFDRFRKWLKLGRNEEDLHVAGFPAAGASGASFSEGGAVYATTVTSGDYCEDTIPVYSIESTPCWLWCWIGD